jgi:hypothetical protein
MPSLDSRKRERYLDDWCCLERLKTARKYNELLKVERQAGSPSNGAGSPREFGKVCIDVCEIR